MMKLTIVLSLFMAVSLHASYIVQVEPAEFRKLVKSGKVVVKSKTVYYLYEDGFYFKAYGVEAIKGASGFTLIEGAMNENLYIKMN